MGCDLHLHAEIKVKDRWEHYSEMKTYRSYEMFGLYLDRHVITKNSG